jgi:hypothetical protein
MVKQNTTKQATKQQTRKQKQSEHTTTKTTTQSMERHKPGKFRLRGGELAAEDCLLEGIQGDNETVGPSYRGLGFGEVAPDVSLGDTAAE